MRTPALAVLLFVGCGGAAVSPRETAQALETGQAFGEPCGAELGCAEGLKCEAGRGAVLCLPAGWFSGKEGGWCFAASDCGPGLRCDVEQAPHPIVDGVCRASSQQ